MTAIIPQIRALKSSSGWLEMQDSWKGAVLQPQVSTKDVSSPSWPCCTTWAAGSGCSGAWEGEVSCAGQGWILPIAGGAVGLCLSLLLPGPPGEIPSSRLLIGTHGACSTAGSFATPARLAPNATSGLQRSRPRACRAGPS